MKEIYRVLSGAMGDEQRLAQIANNLANVSTPGFKKDGAVFVDYLRQQLADQGKAGGSKAADKANAPTGAWPVLGSTFTDYSTGPMQQTGAPLDVAIEGEGFFQVQVAGEKQPLYTRAGNFKLTVDGDLQTADGKAVLSDGGQPIKLDPQAGRIQITQEGEIYTGTTTAGKLGIVKFADPQKLEKYGAGLYRAPQGVAPQAVTTAVVRQGSLEGSNVNAIDEMVRMIQTERSYQTAQRAAQTIDESFSKRIDAANS